MHDVERINPDDLAATPERLADATRPVVIAGLVRHWPAVQAARQGDLAIGAYLSRMDDGVPLTVFTAAPGQQGRFFYSDAVNGLNFGTEKVRARHLLAALLDLVGQADPPSLYAGAAPTAETMRRFASENPMPVALGEAEGRIWIGNRSRIATHYDTSNNLACCVAGRRMFTIFPPEEVANLYVGPLDRTPAGQPVSMVDLDDPDLARFPLFATALRSAMVARLEPGDALFIPALWWHHVAATAEVNVLVNYWQAPRRNMGAPLASLIHAIHSIRDLPAAERDAWEAWFRHYVFNPEASAASAHLPEHAHGVMGAPSEHRSRMVEKIVGDTLFPRGG